jgi:hypothetical protein
MLCRSAAGRYCCVLTMMLVMLVGPGCQLVPTNPSRRLTEHFIQALQGDSDVRLESYLAPDAEIWLQGASVPLSGAGFQEYVEVMHRGRRRFHAASRIFLTTGGAGWLLSITRTEDEAAVDPPGPAMPPVLWMAAAIHDQQITRVWIHFTVEALGRMVTPQMYRAAAASRGTPVPDGWAEGTPAMLAAAERTDGSADRGWTDSSGQLMILGASLLAGVVAALTAHRRRRTASQQTPRHAPGALLDSLRKAHSSPAGRNLDRSNLEISR